MGLSAGELDRRITIEIATKTRDAANDEVPGWAVAFSLWAKKRDYTGRENLGAQQVVREFDTLFTVRWSQTALGISPESHRVRYHEAIYELVGRVEAEDRHDGINLLCASRPDKEGARGADIVSDGSP